MGSLTLALVKVILQSFRAQSSDTKYRTMKFAIAVCGVLATSAIAAPFHPVAREADAHHHHHHPGYGYGYRGYRREASADAAPVAAPYISWYRGYGGRLGYYG